MSTKNVSNSMLFAVLWRTVMNPKNIILFCLTALVLVFLIPPLYLQLNAHSVYTGLEKKGAVDMGISAWAIPMMVILTVAEGIFTFLEDRHFNRKDTMVNIGLGFAVAGSGIFVRAAQWFLYSILWLNGAQFFGFDVLSWVLAFLLTDLVGYWFHRLGHEVNVLWAAHFTHHSSLEFNLSVGVRNSIIHVFYRYIFYAPLCLLGFHPVMIITCDAIANVYSFFLHTKKVKKLGVLEYFMCTPSHHRVHHGSNDIYLDKNYGAVFIIWDRIFGTFVKETEPVVYGLKDGWTSQKPAELLFYKWRKIIANLGKGRNASLLFGKPSDA